MYLQITTKCGMHCDHCCFSCGHHGKHMSREIWQKAIDFASRYDDKTIAIGGGEPTMHPDFFEILQRCVDSFDRIWMATNGSKTKVMWRLADILHGNGPIFLKREDQLHVSLSLDYFHDPIDEKVEEYWKKWSKPDDYHYFPSRSSGFSIRDVTKSPNGAIAVGRAKRTGVGWATGCVCADTLILPTGKIKVCGCPNSPIIGDIWNGIEKKWETFMEEEEILDTHCYNGHVVSEHI